MSTLTICIAAALAVLVLLNLCVVALLARANRAPGELDHR
jgi:hypothetical protein